ncbi:Sec-independent protein translocase protein TatB [Pseudooceanicola marinus]|uniref:Sec-independent protein translocase protein TatB n=1 Tax=Pseudooceanicola marinus TaxID=396013 RepID=A0A1X6ZEE4_9RHOB|nr:Sec-independent protein translocase protein TatB [Pseudooceanicola marinus]PJE28391.1 twin-arginine translocase subunit TatB [Pseudooceanicola marinus]SLN48984.1 Sec-independent protein translocase protein TatB [Pseudooceanicola marinus]
MFGMGGTEVLLVGIVALIVVGPKELPGLFRSVGQFVGKARGMAREFSRAMEDAADQSGMKEATDSLKGASNSLKGLSNPKKYGLDKVKQAANPLKWEEGSETAKLAADRAEAAKKIHESTAKAAQTRLDAEAAAASETAKTTTGQGLAVPELPKAPVPAPKALRIDPEPAAPAQTEGLRQTAGQRAAGAARKPAPVQPRRNQKAGATAARRRPVRKG